MNRYSIAGFTDYVPKSPGVGRRWTTFTSSAVLHAVILTITSIVGANPNTTQNEQARLAKPHKVLLYYPPPKPRKLPDVSPVAADRVIAPSQRASIKAPQVIQTRVEKPTLKADQFIRIPVPKIQDQKPLPMPTPVLVQEPPLVAPPPAPKPAPNRFIPPPKQEKTGLKAQVNPAAEAPKLAMTIGDKIPDLNQQKRFVPPPPPVKGKAGGTDAGTGIEPAAAPPRLAATAQGPSMVIISMNPTPGAPPPPSPEGNRDASISVGGSPGSGTASGGLVAPGVVVRGANAPSSGNGSGNGSSAPGPAGPPPAVASTEVKPPVLPTGAVPRPQINRTVSVSVPLRPNSRKVPPEVETAFRNRVVYSSVVASAPGQPEWIIWFAELPGTPPERVVIRPPVPEKPASLPAALPGMQPKMWISDRMTKEGVLSGVSVPQLAAVLAKWLFFPAIRNGQAAEVEVLIEGNWRP